MLCSVLGMRAGRVLGRGALAIALVLVAGWLVPSLFGQQPTLGPNVRVMAVDPAERLSGATLLGEWAVDGNLEGWALAGGGTLSVQWGALRGAGAGSAEGNGVADLAVQRVTMAEGPDLDFGFNDYLQVRIKVSSGYSGGVRFEYGTSQAQGFAGSRVFEIPSGTLIADGQFHVYRLDLGLEVAWRDRLRDLRVTLLGSAGGSFELDYLEVGDLSGSGPAFNPDAPFADGLSLLNAGKLESKHACVWWDPADLSFTPVHARRALRMLEESYQVFCRKLGYQEPFREWGVSGSAPLKMNLVTWPSWGGYWMSGYQNRGFLHIDASGLGDEGWGSPVPHEFAHVVQAAQSGALAGGHWESHANYLRASRNLHFFDVIPNATPGLDNLSANSNYRPDHLRHIYADQRYYLALDDYGTQLGLPANFTATAWRQGEKDKTLIEKLSSMLPQGISPKDVACEALKRWPMLDFIEKQKLRAQHWGTEADRAMHFWKQGARLVPQQDKPGWWRVPLERAPDAWAYQVHELSAAPGTAVDVEIRGLNLAGSGESWRWCIAAVSSGDSVRYSPVWGPGSQNFSVGSGESRVFLIVVATPDQTALDLGSLSNTKPVDKHPDRLRYAYEVRLSNALPAPNPYALTPGVSHAHPNGGGWVENSATVDVSAYVGPNAKVLGTARVTGSARIEDYAVIKDSARVEGSAVVSGHALVEGDAQVSASARVRDRAQIGWGARLKDRAWVGAHAFVQDTTVQGDAVVRGCAYPFGGTLGGTAIADHDYSMAVSVNDGVHFSHVPWGDWWNSYYAQTLRKPRGLLASYRTEEPEGELWWDEFGAMHAFLRGSPLRERDGPGGLSGLRLDGV
ncbi:MAG: hypothetical protein RLZZ244_1086, partial [Verrucomicrobiota bacterium]